MRVRISDLNPGDQFRYSPEGPLFTRGAEAGKTGHIQSYQAKRDDGLEIKAHQYEEVLKEKP